jgi:hypothetical protein
MRRYSPADESPSDARRLGVDLVTFSFRMADRLLAGTEAWTEIESVLSTLSLDQIVRRHEEISLRRDPPAGAQTAINSLLDSEEDGLRKPGWTRQVRLFPPPGDSPFVVAPVRRNVPVEDDPLRAWTMDFKRDRVGVEVSFNHAEATAWQFTKLSIAGESEYVQPSGQIDVGVVVTAHTSLKRWGKMDGAVLTFDVCRSWLAQMKRVVPTPLLLVGLTTTETEPNAAFRGTRRA